MNINMERKQSQIVSSATKPIYINLKHSNTNLKRTNEAKHSFQVVHAGQPTMHKLT
jgi:hypothetical protein